MQSSFRFRSIWDRSTQAVRSFDWRDRRRVFSLAMMLIGLVLLGYVAREYGVLYFEQRELVREFEEENSEALQSQPGAPPHTRHDGLTRVRIPKIDLDAIVVEGTGLKQLRIGPGRIVNSALPGEPGNSVITAHRDTFFRHIGDLQTGDEIQIQRDGNKYIYKVVGRKIVKPTDLSVIKPTKESRLTLITCYPTYYIGPAPERLVVFSTLVDQTAAQSTAADVHGKPSEDAKAQPTVTNN